MPASCSPVLAQKTLPELEPVSATRPCGPHLDRSEACPRRAGTAQRPLVVLGGEAPVQKSKHPCHGGGTAGAVKASLEFSSARQGISRDGITEPPLTCYQRSREPCVGGGGPALAGKAH